MPICSQSAEQYSWCDFRPPIQEVENIAKEVNSTARMVVIAIGPYASDEYINLLRPVDQLKTGYHNLTEDTVKDAARLICNAVPFVSDGPWVPDDFTENIVEPNGANMAATLCRESSQTVYPFNVTTIQDSQTFLLGSRFQYTVVLIVNVASFSGMAKSTLSFCVNCDRNKRH